MDKKKPEVLVARLMELCSITCNKLNNELPAHYREMDAIKEELLNRLK